MIEIILTGPECDGEGCDDWTHAPDCSLFEVYVSGPYVPDSYYEDDDADSI